MKRRRKKKRILDPTNGADSVALHSVIVAMMKGLGRGGLTQMAETLGTASPSTLRKRMSNPKTAFDEVTMRAVLLVAGSKAEEHFQNSPIIPKGTPELISSQIIEGFLIEVRSVDGKPTPFWKVAE